MRDLQVRDRGLWLHSYKDVPPARKGAILHSMFPPAQSSEDLGSSSSDVPVDAILAADTVEEENETSRSHTVNSDNPGSECDFLVDGATLTDGIKAKVEMDKCLHLERCMRIVPHDQDSGAFFIAVLRKLASFQGKMYLFSVNCSYPFTLLKCISLEETRTLHCLYSCRYFRE